jgi:hypothetical protein
VKYCTLPEREHINAEIQISDVAVTNPELRVRMAVIRIISIWLLVVIYALAGCPGSYVLWYKPLYRAMSNESALRLGGFFLTTGFTLASAYSLLLPLQFSSMGSH